MTRSQSQWKPTLCLALVLSGGLFCHNCDAAIIYPKAPEGGRQVVYKNLDAKFLGVSQVEDLAIADPHREYFVGATSLASGHLLDAAKFAGWRYLLLHETNAVGAAELKKDLRFNSLQKSGFGCETLEALRIAKELPEIKKQDYELRYLTIPAVNFVAVWLHAKSNDIIIPLPPTWKRLNAYQPHSEKQIIQALKKDAKAVKKQPKLIR